MNKDPAFLFYTSDFLTDCSDLTMEERGQLITLFCLQHQKGRLSEKIIHLSVGELSEDVKNKLSRDENNLYYSPKIEELIEQRKKFAESRRKNGLLGGRPKKPSGLPSGLPSAKPNAKPNAKPTENLPENVNVNENININNNLNKLIKKIVLKKGQYLIDESFNIHSLPEIEIYEKEVGSDIINKVEHWLFAKKNGEIVDKEFICRQIINFTKRSGKLCSC